MMTLAVHPLKAASASCLKGLLPGLEEGLGVIGICCSGLICAMGTSSIARPPLPACGPFFYTFQRVQLKALSGGRGAFPSASHLCYRTPLPSPASPESASSWLPEEWTALVLNFPHSGCNPAFGSRSHLLHVYVFWLLNHIVVPSFIFPFLPVYTLKVVSLARS